jgi:hypothetical protein
MALANITNNILTDSGILVSSLQGALTLTTTGSSGASTLIGNTLNIPNYGGGLTGYVPYTGATGSVNLGTNDLTSRYLVANGSAGLGGVLNIKQDAAYSPLGNGFSSIASSSNSFDFFGYTGASTYKNFQLRFDGLTNNTVRTYTLPDASGTIALTSALSGMVTGTGTTNYLPKFTGTSTIGNSQVIDDGDGVGIGLISPQYKLHVVSSSTSISAFRNSGASAGQILVGNTVADLGLRILASGDSLIYSDTSKYLAFGTNGATEKMRLDASGNLGLGVTPSAWAGGYTVLQVLNLSLFGTSGLDLNLASNTYYDGTSYKYIGNGFATMYNQFQGKHYWSTAGTSTAGNTISFTQAMTLNASGNLSIGNTNDTYKLDVSGTGRFTGMLTSSLGNNNRIFTTNGATTGYLYADIINTGGRLVWGVETSTGNTLGSGYDAYASVIASNTTANLNFGTNAIKRFTLDGSTGAATFSSSVTAKGFINDTATGISSSGGMFRLSNGYTYFVGNSTDNGAILSNGAGTATVQALSPSGSTGYLLFETGGGSERMRITSGGNVGIGSSSPLAVTNFTTLTINGTSASLIEMQAGGTSYARIQASSSEMSLIARGNTPMVFYTNPGSDTERMRITSGGNVGIGSTNTDPLSLGRDRNLAIVTTSTNAALTIVGGSAGRIDFGVGSTRTAGIYSDVSNYTEIFTSTSLPLVFSTNSTERMRITSAGEACIGRTTAYGAGFLLNVQGNIYASAAIVTGAPSGGSSANWKLGGVNTGTCVPSSWGDFTSWFTGTVIDIEINGTTYKIPAVISNYC